MGFNLASGISIHTLRVEGDSKGQLQQDNSYISIHTLRMEGDLSVYTFCFHDCISIHTLRMEGDFQKCNSVIFNFHFNPHPPHGG